jgi:hypothetical protein
VRTRRTLGITGLASGPAPVVVAGIGYLAAGLVAVLVGAGAWLRAPGSRSESAATERA